MLPALSVPETNWSFCPSLGAAIAFTILFALTMTAHIVQAIYYRKAYCWVITMSAIWQIVAYVTRIISLESPANLGPYVSWFVLILV